MKPQRLLAETPTADRGILTLTEHDGRYHLRLNGRSLMSTGQTASEIQLAEAAAKELGRPGARVLIGGLGFGFTLRRVLELTPSDAEVVVAEILPPVVQWNREFLREVNGALLDDPRVRLHLGDVFAAMANARRGAFRAILLDVDNGPDGLTRADNDHIYSLLGLQEAKRALRPGGLLAIWSAAPDERFARRLKHAGYQIEEVMVRSGRNNKGARHIIWFARTA